MLDFLIMLVISHHRAALLSFYLLIFMISSGLKLFSTLLHSLHLSLFQLSSWVSIAHKEEAAECD